jgi:hypothetical protein
MTVSYEPAPSPERAPQRTRSGGLRYWRRSLLLAALVVVLLALSWITERRGANQPIIPAGGLITPIPGAARD